MTQTPDRTTVSFPDRDDVDLDLLDDLVDESEHATRSAFIRDLIREAED